jgi:hypothetical protein
MMESLPEGVQADEVRATIDDLESGLHLLSRSKAVNRIDDWHRILDESDRDDLHAIAEGLGELKGRLLGPDLDADAIGQTLARLGEQTLAASEHATREDVGKAVERLGNLLLHAGHALRGPQPSTSD